METSNRPPAGSQVSWPWCFSTAAISFRFFSRRKSLNFATGGLHMPIARNCPASEEILRSSSWLKASNGSPGHIQPVGDAYGFDPSILPPLLPSCGRPAPPPKRFGKADMGSQCRFLAMWILWSLEKEVVFASWKLDGRADSVFGQSALTARNRLHQCIAMQTRLRSCLPGADLGSAGTKDVIHGSRSTH